MRENHNSKENENKNRHAILAGVCLHDDQTDDEFLHAIEETKELMRACELEVVCVVTQNLPSPHPGTYFGSGKLEELARAADFRDAAYVIVLDNLSPVQLKNMTDVIDAVIFDRTTLILEIFARRARSREAKLQIELANLQYMLPRLVGMRKSLGRQGGASGSMSNKGAGEKKLELDRRHIGHRITELRRELAKIERTREVQRKSREKGSLKKVALVGYTNAGKSTIMNQLVENSCSDDKKLVLEKDMLFATLDTTVRRIVPEDKREFLLSDTVGFISNLPHELVKAFHSTLEEVLYADLLLIVVDMSDIHYKEHLKVTQDTLKELGAASIPQIYAYNKLDRFYQTHIDEEQSIPIFRPGLIVNGERVYLCANQGKGIKELIGLIQQKIFADYKRVRVFVPYDQGAIIGRIESNAIIISREYKETGVELLADMKAWFAGALMEEDACFISLDME